YGSRAPSYEANIRLAFAEEVDSGPTHRLGQAVPKLRRLSRTHSHLAVIGQPAVAEAACLQVKASVDHSDGKSLMLYGFLKRALDQEDPVELEALVDPCLKCH